MKHLGIVDIGSNTVRLVIYNLDDQNHLSKLFDYKKMLQLLNFVDHQELNHSGLKALIDTLDEYKQIVSYYACDELICFGTASLRYLNNKQEVVRKVYDYTGLNLVLLSGEAESTYGFEALLNSDILKEEGISVDVGGGSTEIIHYKDRQIIDSISLPMGCLSLKIKHMDQIFPNKYEIEEIRHDIQTLLDQIHWINNIHVASMIGIGGSARAITKTINALHPSKRMSHGDSIDMSLVHALSILEVDQQAHIAPVIFNAIVERSSTLHTGALIFSEIAKRTGASEFTLSRYGIREGYVFHHYVRSA